MGTFGGHVAPGTYLALIATWWTVELLLRYHKSKSKGTEYRSFANFKCSCLCGRLKTYEIDGLCKFIFCIILLFFEISRAFVDGKFYYYGNGQHATIFFIIGLSGVLDILRHHKFSVPEEVTYIAYVVLLCTEWVLFTNHLHGRHKIDVLIHSLILYVILINIVVVAAEMRYRDSILIAITRCYLFMFQGVWFIVIGFILFNPFWQPTWDPENHDHFMLATMMFTWVGLSLFCFILVLNCFISWIVRRSVANDYRHLVNGGDEVVHFPDEKKSLTHSINMQDNQNMDDFD